MIRSCPVLFCAFAIVSLTGTVPSESRERLTAKEIRQLFPGTFRGTVKNDKREITVAISTNGHIRARVEGKFDEGRWVLEGNRFCVTWKHWSKAKKHCRHVIRDGKWYKAVKANGSVQLKFRR